MARDYDFCCCWVVVVDLFRKLSDGIRKRAASKRKNRELYVTMRASVIDAARPTNQSTRPNPPKAAHGNKYKCVMSSREEAEEAPPLAHLLCLLRPSVHRVVPVR